MHLTVQHRPFYTLLFFYIAIISVVIYYYQGDQKIVNSTPPTLPTSIDPQKQDYAVMRNWHLFGVHAEVTLNQVKNSKIKLIGIIYHLDHKKRTAIVLIDDKEYLLHYGDAIGSEYTIHKIDPSRIIVNSHNGLEELTLFAN